MKQRLVSLVTLVGLLVVLAALLPPAAPVASHASALIIVPRLDSSRPAPNVNGYCDLGGEYINSLRYSILYRPRYNWEPVQLRLVASSSDLYLCLSNMPRGGGDVADFVSVAIDTAHDGGRVPDNDDISLTINQQGQLSASRGDGVGGFSPASDITGWTARTDPQQEITWSAEYRIPLTLLGGGAPYSLTGLHIRHNWLRSVGDDYAWPSTGGWNVPGTWGDLWWGSPAGSPGSVYVDVARVSQGLEYDVSGRTAYDLIAAKETLVRAQLYTTGPLRDLTYSACVVRQRTALVSFGLRIPVSRSERRWPVSYWPAAPRVNAMPYRWFNGVSVFNCWLPGSLVAEPGDYQIELEVGLSGSSTLQRLDLGTHIFQPSGDLRLMVYRWIFPPGHPEHLPWNNDLSRNIIESLQEVQRMYPLRSGITSFNWSGTPTTWTTPNLRWHLVPSVYQCPAGGNVSACDARARGDAWRMRQDYNARLREWDARDGLRRDRFDEDLVLTSTPRTGGGQAQFFTDHCSAGAGFDPMPGGASATVIGQELAHCLEQVRSTSPHANPADTSHSSTWEIPLYQSRPMVNMRTRQDIWQPITLLNAFVTNTPVTINEGWEWNDLRRTLLSRPRPALSAADATAARPAAEPLLQLSGMIDVTDVVTIEHAARVEDLALDPTPADDKSPYALLFRDAQGTELSRLPFAVSFTGEVHDEQSPPSVIPLLLVAPIPSGATRVEIQKSGTRLYFEIFSIAAPSLGSVNAQPDGQGSILLSWSASDPDSPVLRSSIYFVPQADAIPQLIASGLRGTSYSFAADTAPATNAGRLLVEVSDGYHTDVLESNTFAIAERDPLVAISAPVTADTLIAGQSATLLGLGYDFSAGQLSGTALSWSSDKDGSLGSGEQLEVRLTPGSHQLTLSATAPSGRTASSSVQVTVLADSDGDALTDEYEGGQSCLSASSFDSDADVDGDSMAALGEQARGTNPCQPDSDADGVGDGDEARLGSDPLNTSSQPAQEQVFVSEQAIELGRCPESQSKNLAVETSASSVEWSSASGADWLSVSGGGTGSGTVTLSADCRGLAGGRYTGRLLLGSQGGQLHVLEVFLDVPHKLYVPQIQR